MNRLSFSRILMIAAILLIVAFQGYWINRIYREERSGLEKETNGIFRDVVYNLQVEKFRADTVFFKERPANNLFVYNAVNAIRSKVAHLRTDIRHSPDTTMAMPGSVMIMRTGKHDPDSFSSGKVRDTAKRVFYVRRPEMSYPEPPMPDTGLLNKLGRAGVNIVVKMGPGAHDSFARRRAGPAQAKAFGERAGMKKIIMPDHDDEVKLRRPGPSSLTKEKSFIRMITTGKALDDTIPLARLDSAYKNELAKIGILIGFSIKMAKDDSAHLKDTVTADKLRTDIAKVGLIDQYWYQAGFESPAGYLLKKITPQILFSLFLVAFTSLAFLFLYRNLAAQRRLTVIKNDFINNITHELKTPISTVNVAIEALRNFGGLQSPERTKEYLDISASEIQRLGLLVDKVLKLSLFENNATDLQKESFDLLLLVNEVMSSMKLQFGKAHAVTTLETRGENFMIDADKLHITSVVYNLLDNALKYSGKEPRIDVQVIRESSYFELRVSDNGIGISPAYQKKIFEQFFRVPGGDTHNIKGYGLGLSYVNHIVKQHHGIIEVSSEQGKGSIFVVKLPFAETDEIRYDKDRKIKKRKFL